MKSAYLTGIISLLFASFLYLLFSGVDGYEELEAALHSVPTWLFGED